MAVPKVCSIVLFLCVVVLGTYGASHNQHDPDLIFDELNSIQADSNYLSNSINPLSSPLKLSPDDKKHHKHHQHKKRKKAHNSSTRLGSLFDDEDFYRDAEDGPSGEDLFSHSGDGVSPIEPPITKIIPEDGPFYFRIGFTITNLQYTPELAQKTSPEFRRVAEELILALEALYRTIHGQQAVTVISFRPLTHSSREHVLVTLDVGSLGNNDRSSIERVIKEAIINGNVGRYTVSDENFSIRGFGAPSQPLPTSDECPPDHLSCSSGECINILKRCDGREDCRDGSDEIGCHRTQTSDLNPKFDSGCRSDSQMICQDGTCIDTIRVCDGVKDCSFGEDEQNCGV